MPKIGAPKGDADRPYVTVCEVCGCQCEKAVSMFGPTGRPARWAYLCQTWQHRCGTVDREGCKPRRVYTDTPEGAELAKRQLTEDLGESDATGPGVPVDRYDAVRSDLAVDGIHDFLAKLAETPYCFEGDCGVCGACKLKAAGYGLCGGCGDSLNNGKSHGPNQGFGGCV